MPPRALAHDPHVRDILAECEGDIRAKYPAAAFAVTHGGKPDGGTWK